MKGFLLMITAPFWLPLFALGVAALWLIVGAMDFAFGDADGYERAREDT